MIDVLMRISYESYINSVGTNKKPRQVRFDGFTQNNLTTNRNKCKFGCYPKNILTEEIYDND